MKQFTIIKDMKKAAGNTKKLWPDYFGMPTDDRNIMIVFVLAFAFLLNACNSTGGMTANRMPDLGTSESGQSAYVWISGERVSYWKQSHYASIIKIGSVYVPSEFLPVADSAPSYTKLLEIPEGRHTIEILYKEDTNRCGYKDCIVVNKIKQTLTFIAEANRTYSPFVDVQCSRTGFWIEDWGSYSAGTKNVRSTSENRSDLTLPVVAGKAPDKNRCE